MEPLHVDKFISAYHQLFFIQKQDYIVLES